MTRTTLAITLLGFGCADLNNDGNIGDNIDPGDGGDNTDNDGGNNDGGNNDGGNNDGNDNMIAGHAYGLVENDGGIALVDMESGDVIESYDTSAYEDVDYFSVTGSATTWIQVDYDLGYGQIVKVPGSEMANVIYVPAATFVDTSANVYMMDHNGIYYKMVDGVLQSIGQRDCTYDGNDHQCGSGRQISSDAFVWVKGGKTYCELISSIGTEDSSCGSLPDTDYGYMGIATLDNQLYGITELDGTWTLVQRIVYEDASPDDITVAEYDFDSMEDVSWKNGSTMYVIADHALTAISLTDGSYEVISDELADDPLAIFVAE